MMTNHIEQGPQIHSIAVLEPGLRIHYAIAGNGPRTLVLVHGFPQNLWEWRFLMPLLAAGGLRVVAVDYRGAGNSSKPLTGYDKITMATDIRRLLRDHLGISDPVAILGHDIGAMVAYAYASQFRSDTSHLIVMDSCVPGTAAFDALRINPRAWHISFHSVQDLPELLVQGREAAYLRFIVENLIVDPSKFTAEVMDSYARAFAVPGAVRSAFNVYRAFGQDIEDNRANLVAEGKLHMPVLGMSGALSPLDAGMIEMLHDVAENVSASCIQGTGHWLAEEKPEAVSEALLKFLA